MAGILRLFVEVLKSNNGVCTFYERLKTYKDKLTLRAMMKLVFVLYMVFVPIFWILWSVISTFPQNFTIIDIVCGCILLTLFSYLALFGIYLLGFLVFFLYKSIPLVWSWIWN